MAPKRKRTGSEGASTSRNSRRKREPIPPRSPPHRPPPRYTPVVIDVEDETWDIRDPALDFFVPEDEYRDEPGKFSVAFHHGGSFFSTNDSKKYVGGHLTYFDFCNIEKFQLIDLSSMVLRLKYDRKMICEFYYCDPKYSHECAGVLIGGPLLPIVEETHLKDFLKVASTTTKLVHIYVLEITRAEAILKKMKEEAQELLSFKAAKPPGVIIEEIEEDTPNVPRQKPRTKRKQQSQFQGQEPLMIGWYDRDVEFEEYLTKSLEDDRAERKRADDVARQNLAKAFEAVSPEAPVSDFGEVSIHDMEFVAEKICVVDNAGEAEAGGGDSHAHVHEDVATASSVDHSTPIVDSHAQVHQPSSVGPSAFVEEDVYRPVLDEGSQLQPDMRVDNDFFPIIEDITHELFMPEANTQVQEPAPAEAVCVEPGPVEGEVPQQADEGVVCPSADYVPDGCHLHNEGSNDEDEDNDVGHFISLANMCRDEQMFTSYYESLRQEQHPEEVAGQEGIEEPSGEAEGSGQGGSKKRRKYSPVVEKMNSRDSNPLFEQETVDELQDLEDLEDLEGLSRQGIKYTPFKLTNDVPNWKPGDFFKHRQFFSMLFDSTQ